MTARTHGWSHANQNTERKIVRTLTWLHDHHFIGKNLIISDFSGPKHAKMYFKFKNFDFLLTSFKSLWLKIEVMVGWSPWKIFIFFFFFFSIHFFLSFPSTRILSMDESLIAQLAFERLHFNSIRNRISFSSGNLFLFSKDVILTHVRKKEFGCVCVCVCVCIQMGVCVHVCVRTIIVCVAIACVCMQELVSVSACDCVNKKDPYLESPRSQGQQQERKHLKNDCRRRKVKMSISSIENLWLKERGEDETKLFGSVTFTIVVVIVVIVLIVVLVVVVVVDVVVVVVVAKKCFEGSSFKLSSFRFVAFYSSCCR